MVITPDGRVFSSDCALDTRSTLNYPRVSLHAPQRGVTIGPHVAIRDEEPNYRAHFSTRAASKCGE